MAPRKTARAAPGSGSKGPKHSAKAPLMMEADSDEEFNADTSADTIALNTSGRRPLDDEDDEDDEQVFDLDVSDEEDGDEEEDDEEDGGSDDSNDDDNYEVGSEDEEEDEDELVPAKGSKGRRKSKDEGSRAYVYESDEDDEDEDDEKMPRRKAKKTPTKSAKPAASDSEDDEEDDSDVEQTPLDKLLKSLPAELRRPTAAYEDDDEDGSDEEEEQALSSWGKSKRAYYHGDTADLEIGQEFEDAEDEEEAAKEIRQQHMKHMDLADFGGDASDSKKKATKGKKGEAVSQLKSDLGQIALGQKLSNGVEIQKVTRDLSNATTQEKLKALKSDAPELLVLLNEMKGKVDELKEKVIPLVQQIRGIKTTDDDAVKYMEVKQQVLLTYCVNVVFYMLMKAEGKSVKDHPVMRQLLELRYAMEKMRPLDAKLQYQIDRLLKMAERGATEDDVSRPNPLALVPKGGRDDSDEEDEEAGTAVYKAPKIAAMMYDEDDGKSSKRDKQLKKKKESMKRSEIMDALREEFSERPMEESSTGVGLANAAQKKLAEEEEEQRLWEEQRFTRAFISKKDRQAKRRREQDAHRLDKLADVGDFGEFADISELVGGDNEPVAAAQQELSGRDAAAALQRAVNVFSQSSKKSKHVANDDEDIPRKNRMEIRVAPRDDDDFNDEFFGGMKESAPKEKRVRRPIPEMDDADLPEEDPLYAALTQRKAAVKKAKQDHYSVAPTYGAASTDLEEGEKRGASHEIIENRGLRPHKKRSTKNPRVKKREQFRKAVIRRKGQVRDVRTGEAGAYGGESTGIKAGVAKSRTLRS